MKSKLLFFISVLLIISLSFFEILAQSKFKIVETFKLNNEKDSIIYFNRTPSNSRSISVFCNYLKDEKIIDGIYSGMYYGIFESGLIINLNRRIPFKINEFYLFIDSNYLFTQESDYTGGSLKINKYFIGEQTTVLERQKIFDGDMEIYFDVKSNKIFTSDLFEGSGTRISVYSENFDSLATVFPDENGFTNMRIGFKDNLALVAIENSFNKNKIKIILFDTKNFIKKFEKDIDTIGAFLFKIIETKSGFLVCNADGRLTLINLSGDIVWSKTGINNLVSFNSEGEVSNYDFEKNTLYLLTRDNFIDEIQEIDGYLLKHNMLKFESQNEFAKEIIYLKNFDELCIVTNYVRNNIIETNNLYDINLKEKFKLNKTELGRINAGTINLKNRVGFILKDKIVEYEK